MIIITLYLLQATYKGKNAGPRLNFLVCILTRSVTLYLSFLFGNLIYTLPVLCRSINWGGKVSDTVWIFVIVSPMTARFCFSKRKTKPQISVSWIAEIYFAFMLQVSKSSAPCETLRAQTPDSVLSRASAITGWGERCWQIMHRHLKLSPRNGTSSLLTCLYLVGQSKSHSHIELESEWGGAVLPHTWKEMGTT